MTYRSKEEKKKLIQDYESSGLSLSKWCLQNHIPTSTFSYWLNPDSHNKNKKVVNNKTSFMEISLSNSTNDKISAASSNGIIIEYDGFKISVNDISDITLLSNVLKAVKLTNV